MADWKRQWPVVPTFIYGGMNYGRDREARVGNAAEAPLGCAADAVCDTAMARSAALATLGGWTVARGRAAAALPSIWGATYMFIEIGLRDLSPAMIACLRVALGGRWCWSRWRALAGRAWSAVRGRAGIVALIGAVQVAGPFLLIALGEQEISSSLAGILVASAPIFTAVLAIWVDHEERSDGTAPARASCSGSRASSALLGLDLSGSGAALLGGPGGRARGPRLRGRRLHGQAPARRRAPDRDRGLGDGGKHGAGCSRRRSRPRRRSFPASGPLAAVAALGVVGTGIAFAIFYTLIGRVGPATVVHRHLPRAGVRGRLRRRPARRADHRRDDRRAGPDPRGSWLAVEGSDSAGGAAPATQRAPPGSAPRPAPSAARRGR